MEEHDGVWDSLKGLCQGVQAAGFEGLYAYYFEGDKKGKGKEQAEGIHGWDVYQPEKEFRRMGVGSRTNAWRTTDINADYEVRVRSSSSVELPRS